MRHLITLDDLSDFEIRQIFRLADQMRTNLAEWSGFCQGKLLATLFYEPSTRTRLSFESAMGRLNGRTLGFADPHAASGRQGRDHCRYRHALVTNYADLIVVRHSFAGSGAGYGALRPTYRLSTGGDGSHAHPTQALADMYTVIARKKTT